MSDRNIGACERNGAVRIDIRQVPLGPLPGFPMSIPRCIVNIEIPNSGHVDNMELLGMARQQRDLVIGFGKHYCAMAFHFWTHSQMVEKDGEGNKKYLHEEAAAIVDYATNGKWEDAMLSKIGDYTKHSYQVMENRTKEDDDE